MTPSSLSGFLRPEFVLGNDLTHINDPNDKWGLQRIGEDLVTNNALGFDVQIFDPGAALFSDNPADPTVPVILQETVGPGDAGYRNALQAWLNNSVVNKQERGTFVDLGYPMLAGGAMRGWQPRRLDRRSSSDFVFTDPNSPSLQQGKMPGAVVSPFSGIRAVTTDPRTAYQDALQRSGRMVTSGNNVVLFQPAFDTYTSAYEKDGFYQGPWSGASKGSLWTALLPGNGNVTVDRGANGLDDDLQFGVDDVNERETLAPFLNAAEAVRVTVRLENPSLRFVRQSSVEYRGK